MAMTVSNEPLATVLHGEFDQLDQEACAACEAEGAGNGAPDHPRRARTGKPRIQTRMNLRATAPVLDLTKGQQPRVAARKNYVPDAGGFLRFPLPYCEFPELVTFLDLNDVEFVYLKHALLMRFPFLDRFRADSAGNRFRLLHRGLDANEKTIELYRFVSEDDSR